MASLLPGTEGVLFVWAALLDQLYSGKVGSQFSCCVFLDGPCFFPNVNLLTDPSTTAMKPASSCRRCSLNPHLETYFGQLNGAEAMSFKFLSLAFFLSFVDPRYDYFFIPKRLIFD